jgi:hypothetical protein
MLQGEQGLDRVDQRTIRSDVGQLRAAALRALNFEAQRSAEELANEALDEVVYRGLRLALVLIYGEQPVDRRRVNQPAANCHLFGSHDLGRVFSLKPEDRRL